MITDLGTCLEQRRLHILRRLFCPAMWCQNNCQCLCTVLLDEIDFSRFRVAQRRHFEQASEQVIWVGEVRFELHRLIRLQAR